MNKNANLGKSSGEKSNFAKKATLTAITAMAALTLAACGNNDVSAKPAGSSEPKMEQPAKKNENNNTNTDKSSSESGNSDDITFNQNFDQSIKNIKDAGFQIVPGSKSVDGNAYSVEVIVDGCHGRIAGSSINDSYRIDFKESLGPDAEGHADGIKELSEILTELKQMIAEKK
ncbi:hypothetical protein [Lactococcus lactis]|uniref:Uncharacterized protein n=1 Tax=Lactococcus lactis subsp. lactis A12 TaxID=1137134 RepID=S6F4H6_LACLL|nr:hypothetical protein [Lactococcus lactis]CDG03689.1 Putative uncharacterized protein [Lactococcus lactis subsp. lactis A12]SBW29659.1 Hypothetical protein LLA12_00484 [Lactococcus lactis subsp. lactis]